MTRNRRTVLALALPPLLLAGCGRGDAPAGRRPPAAGALPARVQVQVDSGNAAYRDGDFQAALRHFREAARRGPDQAAAWYGVQMAASAAGDLATADTASARLRELAPSVPPAVHHPAAPRRSPAPPTTTT